jgi:hypothetical protein
MGISQLFEFTFRGNGIVIGDADTIQPNFTRPFDNFTDSDDTAGRKTGMNMHIEQHISMIWLI